MTEENNSTVVSLHETIIAFQKSLARVSQMTSDLVYADSEFFLGQRALYAVDFIDVELSAKISIKKEEKPAPDIVLVDFNAPGDKHSTLRFKVEARPIDPAEGPEIILSRSKPLEVTLPENNFSIWVIDEKNTPIPNQEVTLHFLAEGEDKVGLEKTVKADKLGRLTFRVDLVKQKIYIFGTPDKEKLKLSPSKKWFIWATTKIKKPSVPGEEEKVEEKKSDIFPIVVLEESKNG